tara:strand:+ start:10726 stop:13377 length:2652 start_codon:yes stop_codon:yes gene_type:complete
MKGLSHDIKLALDTIIEGLDHRFDVSKIDSDDLKLSMKAKLSSFKSAKELLYQWQNSPNAPIEKTFKRYAQTLADSGDSALNILRRALKQPIDYKRVKENRHYLAIESKTFLLNSIIELEAAVIELKTQIDSGNILLKENEFKRGFPEKFAAGEFYPKSNYHKEPYNEEEDSIVIDPLGTRGEIIVLDGLRVQLPNVPKDRKKILFHKKKKKDQHWIRAEWPRGLSMGNTLAFYDYIMEQFRIRREGLWFYNDGTPTYITGRHWFQLQWGKMMDGGIYPDYRDCQRLLAYHKEACFIDERCMGQIFLKSRQTGFTYGIVSDSIEVATSTLNVKNGLTSMTEDDAKKAFSKQSYLYQELPFFFQPITRGRADSLSKLDFGRPADLSKKSKLAKDTSTEGYLNTSLDYQATKEKAYDGQSLAFYVGDECAKWNAASYIEHINTLLPTIFRGGRVTGKCFLGSTIGKLDQGGEDFKVLYLNSKVVNREKSGYTATKLYSYFMPAHKNFELCIDKYGKCWEEAPPKGTLNTFGKPILIGSIEGIKNLYSEAKKQGDAALNATYRAFPMTENHAMRDEADSCVFNLTKLMDQYDDNENTEIEQTKCVKGNFSWENGIRFSKVEFDPDEHGRFVVYWMPSPVDGTLPLKNQVKQIYDKYHPMNDYGCIGVDSYGSFVKGKNKQSNGSAHGYSTENNVGVPPNIFLFEYIDKPATQDIFNEEILMAAWFYGIQILAENNRKDFVKYLFLENCRPFSMNRIDVLSTKLAGDDLVLGGQPMQSKSTLNTHENAIRTFIQQQVGKKDDERYRPKQEMGDIGLMPFNRTIMDWMKFDPSARTGYDATISSGLSIMGANRHKYKPKPKKVDPKKTVSLLRKYSNDGQIGTYIKES